MHLKRAEVSMKVPIPRKGTKYLARARSHSNKGISVVIAIRDMLGLARTMKEVKLMVNEKMLKLNGREVRDCKEGISLFGILEADKKYRLIVLESGRFAFEEAKGNTRIAKVTNKKILKKEAVQFNLHDGTNILSKEKAKVGDSFEIDLKNKIKKVMPLEKEAKVFVMSGRSIGKTGKVKEIAGKMIKVEMGDREAVLHGSHLIVI